MVVGDEINDSCMYVHIITAFEDRNNNVDG